MYESFKTMKAIEICRKSDQSGGHLKQHQIFIRKNMLDLCVCCRLAVTGDSESE